MGIAYAYMLKDSVKIGTDGQNPESFINNNPALGWSRPYPNWGGYLLNNPTLYPTFNNGDITQALSEFYSHYNSLQVRYEQRFVAGLTLLNSFTWSRALDNASSTLEANTPCPQDGNNLRADYGQSDYNLPVANVTSLVYDLPVGQGRQYLAGATRAPIRKVVRR